MVNLKRSIGYVKDNRFISELRVFFVCVYVCHLCCYTVCRYSRHLTPG